MLGKCVLHEFGVAVADVEVDIVQAVALDLMVDRPGHDVARRELAALVIVGHEAMAGFGMLQHAAFAAHRLGDQEILDLKIVEAGRVELHEFHVGDPAARPPRHRDAVAGRAARRGRIQIGPPSPAGGEHGRPRNVSVSTGSVARLKA